MKLVRRALLSLLLLLVTGAVSRAPAQPVRPESEMRWAISLTLPPNWLDPAEGGGGRRPFGVLHALHGALFKPLPGNLMAPSLAESWTVSADGRVYEFKLREGLKFHNGDPRSEEH